MRQANKVTLAIKCINLKVFCFVGGKRSFVPLHPYVLRLR